MNRAERDDPGLSNTLRKLCVEYAPRKYTVAVFKSGEEDLCDLTSGLLLSNRHKLAEREVESKRIEGPSMAMGM